jgi:hypothetical protein
MSNETKRPTPVLRKEAIETATWGTLVVTCLLNSERLEMGDADAEPAVAAPAAAASDDAEPPADADISVGADGQVVVSKSAGPAVDEAQRLRRNSYRFGAKLLAASVRDTAGARMYSADEWDIWLGTHAHETRPLFDAAMRINGYDLGEGGATKND